MRGEKGSTTELSTLKPCFLCNYCGAALLRKLRGNLSILALTKLRITTCSHDELVGTTQGENQEMCRMLLYFYIGFI